jgi:hypothetical protein
MRLFVLTLGLVALSVPAFAQSGVKESTMNKGYKAWSAFECTELATIAEDANEKNRLYNVGYNYGASFLSEIKNANIVPAYMTDPIGYKLLTVTVPSVDFALGRIYEGAASLVNRDLQEQGIDSLKSKAAAKFKQKKCDEIK